ncbi:MAG: ABC transporter permease [Pseudomonadota bacterium]
MRFTWLIALRFLREGRAQTLLIVGGVSLGVAVMVFLSSLISGLQLNIIARTLGTQAHILVRMPDDGVGSLRGSDPSVAPVFEKPAQRLRTIASWSQQVDAIRTVPGVREVSPSVVGPGFASRGSAEKPVQLRGIDPASYVRIVPVDTAIREGRLSLDGTQALVGAGLAKLLGVQVGDRLRLSSASGEGSTFTISGVFDLQNQIVNETWVLLSLRSAQTLLGLSGDVTGIEVTVAEIFQARNIAEEIAQRTGLTAESWMQLNEQLLVALRSQSSSSAMIQFFVVMAVALGIASVLIVSVIQKSREIGILKAMGARTRDVMRVFLIQGFLVGAVGSAVGIALGVGLILLFAGAARNPDGSPLFVLDLGLSLFVRAAAIACFTGVVAAVAPARRAARLDPAVVIRNG